MNKTGKSSGTQVTIAVGLIAIVVLFGVLIFGDNIPGIGEAGASIASTETGTQLIVGAGVSCPSDDTTNGQIRYQDTLASTNTYGNPTVYFIPKTSGQERITAGTLQTDGTYSTSVDLPCTKAGTSWTSVAVTSQDSFVSVEESSDFTAEGSTVKRDLQGKAIDTLKFKVEDRVTGASTFFNVSVCTGDATGSQGYVDFNGTQCVVADIGGNAALTLAADDFIESTIFIKTNTTKKQFGEDGLRTFMLVNADGSAWDEPIVVRDGGATLSNVLTSLNTEDARHYSGYEFVYDIGIISDRESEIDFFLQTAAGVTPGASADPVIDFCAEGRYNSNKQVDTILSGCWSDASTQAQVETAVLHQLKYEVS